MEKLIEPHEPIQDCDCRTCAVHERDRLRKLLDDAPKAISSEADFDAMTWTFQIGPECGTGGGIYALVWMGPNV